MTATLVLLLLCLLIILTKINIRIEYKRTEENDRFIFSVFKKFIRIDIPFIDVDTRKDTWGTKILKKFTTRSGKTHETTESFISFDRLKEMIDTVRLYYRTYYHVFKRIKLYLKRKITCRILILKLDFGLGDAAETGITSGIVWGVCYNIASMLDRYTVLKKTDINVRPDFNEKRLDIYVKSIFTVRIVHIIIVFFIILCTFIRIFLKKSFLLQKSLFKGKFRV